MKEPRTERTRAVSGFGGACRPLAARVRSVRGSFLDGQNRWQRNQDASAPSFCYHRHTLNGVSMRGAGIGLLSLLVVAAIIFIVMAMYLPPTLKAGKKGQDESQQISGHAASGRPVSETAKFDEVDASDGSFRRVKIVSMDADCPLLVNYNLQPNDEISAIGGIKCSDNNDYKLSVAQVEEAWGRMEALTIQRGGSTMEMRPTGPLEASGVFAKPGSTTLPTP